jgi:hypothetical protein
MPGFSNGQLNQDSNEQSDLFRNTFQQLLIWCREHDFAGHDPFDALNSTLFQATPLRKSKNARFIWTQLVKRSPSDLRTVAGIPAQRNSKGIALFALAQLATHRRLKTSESAAQAQQILSELLSLRLDGFSGAAWGYNFDWQSRNFFAPRGTPTIVPTAFAARALLEAAREFPNDGYLDAARSVCDFIIHDLRRSVETESEVCFSYSPESDTRIYNASLLAAEVLASTAAITGEQELSSLAQRATRYVINQQGADGSWTYGNTTTQSWIDNFHTAFVLFSLARIIKTGEPGEEFSASLKRGYQYWKDHFFLADGWPKYYHDNPYPADTHAGASAIVTYLELRALDTNASRLAQDVAAWTIRNLRDEHGFFYYQRRRFYTVRKPYMRWSQAWMLYALARLLENKSV